MRQHVKAGKAEYHPGSIPVQRGHIVAGEKAEIQQPAAAHQRQHGDEEHPVQHDVDGAPSCLPSAKKSSEANLVQPDAAPKTGPKHIDRVGERHHDQYDGRLHMHHPGILGQNRFENNDPGTIGRFRRDAQSGDECDAERADEHPVQDNRSVVCPALFHARAPLSGRRLLLTSARRRSLTSISHFACDCAPLRVARPSISGRVLFRQRRLLLLLN